MENRSSAPYITVDGYVEVQKYGSLYFVIMFTAFTLIVFSNSLIVYLIWIHPNLHEPMYIFIAALSVNSIIYSTTIYPKLLIDFVSETQIVSYAGCLFQWFTYYNLGGSEFMLLTAMAYDRYVSICKPLRYANIMRRTNIIVFVAFAWLFPICQTIVPLCLNAKKKICNFVFKGIICNSTVYKLYCSSSTALTIYGLVVFVNLVILPALFILFTYSKIFFIARRSNEMKRKAIETCLPHLVILINFTVFSAYDVLLLRIETESTKTIRFIVTLQVIMYHPLFNPIIYGLKMKEINRHIKKLLCSFRKQN
ncbi:olfactory receptor 142-like [Boleophthalmus pectinirostris]|uniref:olfactory receptor 142-like n=1 Tax=Boleophthalmus pectinirostris TaxID=150288 RepID=UPI0024301966|nr:olfactory receptor 142-like [Boleophthalmus pectinirostris]